MTTQIGSPNIMACSINHKRSNPKRGHTAVGGHHPGACKLARLRGRAEVEGNIYSRAWR